MRQSEIKKIVGQAYNGVVSSAWSPKKKNRRLYDSLYVERRKFQTCGLKATNANGYDFVAWCNRPVCPTCNAQWARRLACRFTAATVKPNSDRASFAAVTLMMKPVEAIEDGFDGFATARIALQQAIAYQRRARGADNTAWRSFSIAGTLEFARFDPYLWKSLGSYKQAQYTEMDLGPSSPRTWIPHVHAVVHVGDVGRQSMMDVLMGVFSEVHVQPLEEKATIEDEIGAFISYGAKFLPRTNLQHDMTSVWNVGDVEEYIVGSYRSSRGRQGYRLFVGPVKAKMLTSSATRRSAPCRSCDEYEYDEGMPVVV